jgi:hypothetical protein
MLSPRKVMLYLIPGAFTNRMIILRQLGESYAIGF